MAHAYEHVPYYGEVMRRIGLSPGDFRSTDDLARLPLIERDQVQRDPEYFLSRAEPPGAYVEHRSSGSTGDALSLLHHPFSLFEQAIYAERRRSIISRLAGRRRYRDARVVDMLVGPTDRPTLAQAFRNLSFISPSVRSRQRHYSVVTPLEELVPQLDEYRPDVISSFGSFHEMLFTYLLNGGQRMHLPRVAVYAGDAMTESARAMIGREFGVKVLSTYTASEAPQIGFECEHHRGHHLNVDLFPVRIVSENGRDMPVGESGEVVVSNLLSRGTVLLNYRLNDLAARLPGRCPCGRTLPLLSMVQGRTDEWLEDSRGRHVHSHWVRGFLLREEDVLRFQVVQGSRSRFRAALVTSPRANREAIRIRLQQRFETAFGQGTELRIAFVDSLPRTAAGKTQSVISISARTRAEATGTVHREVSTAS